MHRGQILFAQIMSYLPYDVLAYYVKKHKGDNKIKSFSCRDQLLAMCFAQLTDRSGLRGIESTLRANHHLLYHMGFRCETVSRNTLANANETRPWQIFAGLAQYNRPKLGVSDQQLRPVGVGDSRALPTALASGTFFQMDKATPSD